ncbi:MAG: InlB B-repeat-containing protein, partial [Acholeplasmataceae bacterium]|nr:InlB B-repeat-containing protein [Acholeplasmataceae bacterium]
MKKGLSVIILTLFILTLSACELFEEQPGNVTISFVTNAHTTLHPLTYEKGQTIELPELHDTEDMVFAGWYLDSEKTVPATNLDNQSDDFTVYAKWDMKQYDILIDIYKEVSVNRVLMNEIAMFILNDQGQLHVQKTQDNPLAIESGWQDAPVLEPNLSGPDDDNDIILDAWEMNAFLVSPDGSVYAWGDNTYGQLGTDDKVSRGTFVEITDHIPLVIDERVIKMVGNQTTTFALTNQGRVFAWGSNHANMLLDKTLTESVIPKDITDYICGDTDHFLVDIVVSSDHAIALTAEHQVLVWGFEATGWFGGDDVIVVRDNASNISENVYRFFDTHVAHMTAERDTIILVSASDQILIMGTSEMASDHTLLVIEGDEYGFVTNPDASGQPTIIDVQIAGDTAIFQYSDGTLIGLGDNTTGLIASKKGYDAYVAKAQVIPTNFTPES